MSKSITVDRYVLSFMAQKGGRFASGLAQVWLAADENNSERLAQAFGDLYAEYAGHVAAADAAKERAQKVAA